MADNYLITGYWGEPHVTAENDRGINAAMFGAGRFVLPVGQQFRAEYIGNNTVRLYDGKLMNNGAAAGIPVGEYVDLLISNAGQGKKRNDLIVFQYSQDASTLIESGVFTVVKGTETTGTATDPALTQADLLSGTADFDQMALWRVPVSGTTISAPVKLFSVSKDIPGLEAWAKGAFAPTGYGLGTKYMSWINASNIDSITNNGWYHFYEAGTKFNNIGFNHANLFVYSYDYDPTACVQKIRPYGSATVLLRILSGGTWKEWEVENPPMTPGVEYRTTERCNGNAVYAKRIVYTPSAAFGAEDSSSTLAIDSGISGFSQLVRISGHQERSDGGNQPFPIMAANGNFLKIDSVSASGKINMLSNKYVTARPFVFDLYYTKTS